MPDDHKKTVLLICDVWNDHWCKDLRQRTESLVKRIDDFACMIRQHGGRVLHCPSGTIDRFYDSWLQRQRMLTYPLSGTTVPQEMRPVTFPLDTSYTTGCPDIPRCEIHTNSTKQHDGITIDENDLISDRGQEVYNFIVAEGIERVLMAGTALNMCVVGRPFGVESLVELGVTVRVVSDLVEVFYNPVEPPYITQEQAKWFALGYIESKWCPITTCYAETQGLPEERNMRIHTNLPGYVVARLKRDYRLEYFVETGTAGGDTTELAATVFDHVWSCEIDRRLMRKTNERLRDYSNIALAVEESPAFLRRLKSEICKPTMFWLDAHWCGGPVKPEKECPLLEELDAIGSLFLNGNPCVIIIDDVNLMETPPKPPHDPAQWPTLGDINTLLSGWQEPYNTEFIQGSQSRLLVVTPKAVE